jgi:hypothetical protein
MRTLVIAIGLFLTFISVPLPVLAQPEATATARMDARQIVVGDQVRLFLEVTNKPSLGKVFWTALPDTFNSLEIVEKGKIDTVVAGDLVTYKQRLVITGFDSGLFKVPSFIFPVSATNGDPYTIQTDSFMLAVNTVAVDTTKAFKPIKDVIYVEWHWLDYIWYILVGIVLLILIVAVVVYLVKKKKYEVPAPEGPKETLQERALRLLRELDAKQLWQQGKVKEYYIELTDILRSYIEDRFSTPAMELTTDELLYKAQVHRELQPYHTALNVILTTADLAKFAKAQPAPQEHTDVMQRAVEIVEKSKPIIAPPPTEPGR